MRRVRRFSAGVSVLGLAAIGFLCSPASAVDVLVNGNLEGGGGGPASWNISTSVTGQPLAFANAYELRDQGNNPGPPNAPGVGIDLNTISGYTGANQGKNLAVNFVMTQTVDLLAGGGVPGGKPFTFSGDAELFDASSSYMSTLGEVKVAADISGNYSTDAADYTLWRDALGQTGTGLPADLNSDGIVDQTDYTTWKSNYRQYGAPCRCAFTDCDYLQGRVPRFRKQRRSDQHHRSPRRYVARRSQPVEDPYFEHSVGSGKHSQGPCHGISAQHGPTLHRRRRLPRDGQS